MWIVRLALNRPYTFVVLALVVLCATPVVILRTPTDILPEINIPVISVLFSYTGLSAEDMASWITSNFERSLTTTVNDIDHIDSQTMRGRSVIKIFFHPAVKIEMALAQVTAIAQAILRNLPPGTLPPLIITYNASTVPILQLSLSSQTLSEQEINDLAMNFIRPQLATIQGVGVPSPYGGKMSQVLVDLDLDRLRGKGLTPSDVVAAINTENLIVPGGTVKIGSTEYDVNMNGSTETVDGLNNLPIKTVNGVVITIRDVAHVRNGFAEQTNIVRHNGGRAVLLSIMKTGATSTLTIVKDIYALLPKLAKQLPAELIIKPIFDQSLFVRAAISSVLHESVLAAGLTAMMILIFLGSWRSTLIIAVSIPLSIFCSLMFMSMLGETINIMTLGGLALAVGILVDDATVEVENIHRNQKMGKPMREAILDGAQQIALPAFVSTLCICIVFVPMFFLTGVSRYLFVPLAEAVVFAMLASYFWSRTLVPTMALYLLPHEFSHENTQENSKEFKKSRGFAYTVSPLVKIQERFNRGFEHFKSSYSNILLSALHHPKKFGISFLAACLLSSLLFLVVGENFFPDIDAGEIRMHLRAKTGTRIEETARLADEVEKKVRELIPSSEIDSILDNSGLPYSSINTSYSNNGTFGPADSEILISLSKHHAATANFVKKLRATLPHLFPGVDFYFQPADIVTQILNFGLPSPLDVQIAGYHLNKNFVFASHLQEEMRKIPGIADVHIQQTMDQPLIQIDVDRARSADLDITHNDVARSILISLSGSGQVNPAFWLNPANGVVYSLMSQVPEYHIESLTDLKNLPITSKIDPSAKPQLLENIATLSRSAGEGEVSHVNVVPVLDIYASVQGRDLGGVGADVKKLINQAKKELPSGATVELKGQYDTMISSFQGLTIGLIGAVVLIYALMVVNFQSWSDPFIIITALPGALAGIAWMLFLTGTTISVPALMGAVMCMGVSTSNSILVVSFAKELFEKNGNALEAALQAGKTRLRPVLMTACAMIAGMIPMALGMGEGGEQNAPLARVVIGGLFIATIAALLFVPVVFSLLKHRD
ncbi:MAG: RND transporter [Verrucomicrobia bacterium RIFCSPHIGHO2_12_FULL_41_10]|nr:MAG: RND transporter [Verrucomicrobia bacterium RIFCSPHIGHO2_12_FULL_41_10]HLB34262.1 efflux RND transporter permease subunit [Chthoniobacterales bacterium]